MFGFIYMNGKLFPFKKTISYTKNNSVLLQPTKRCICIRRTELYCINFIQPRVDQRKLLGQVIKVHMHTHK